MNYLINTNLTMKEYNQSLYWISDYVKQLIIAADSLTEALKQYADILADKYYIEISNNALKHKSPMYIDTAEGTKQTGYVITGKTDFENDKTHRSVSQYIDIWAHVQEVRDIEF